MAKLKTMYHIILRQKNLVPTLHQSTLGISDKREQNFSGHL